MLTDSLLGLFSDCFSGEAAQEGAGVLGVPLLQQHDRRDRPEVRAGVQARLRAVPPRRLRPPRHLRHVHRGYARRGELINVHAMSFRFIRSFLCLELGRLNFL